MRAACAQPTPLRIFAVAGALKHGIGVDEIAQLTRGQLLDSADVADVVAAVAALPEIPAEQRRLLIWAHPGWVGFILLLLAVFWVGRKAAGTF